MENTEKSRSDYCPWLDVSPGSLRISDSKRTHKQVAIPKKMKKIIDEDLASVNGRGLSTKDRLKEKLRRKQEMEQEMAQKSQTSVVEVTSENKEQPDKQRKRRKRKKNKKATLEVEENERKVVCASTTDNGSKITHTNETGLEKEIKESGCKVHESVCERPDKAEPDGRRDDESDKPIQSQFVFEEALNASKKSPFGNYHGTISKNLHQSLRKNPKVQICLLNWKNQLSKMKTEVAMLKHALLFSPTGKCLYSSLKYGLNQYSAFTTCRPVMFEEVPNDKFTKEQSLLPYHTTNIMITEEPGPRISQENKRPRITHDNLGPKINLGKRITVDNLGLRITQNQLGPRITQDNLGLRITQDNLGQRVTQDNLGPSITQDNLGLRITQDNLKLRITQDNFGLRIIEDNLGPRITQDNLGPRITQDNLGPRITQDNLGPRITQVNLGLGISHVNLGITITDDNLRPRITQFNLGRRIAQDKLGLKITKDNFVPRITLDNIGPRITQDNLGLSITQDNCVLRITQDYLGPRITQDKPRQRITQDNFGPRKTMDNLAPRITQDSLGPRDVILQTRYMKQIKPSDRWFVPLSKCKDMISILSLTNSKEMATTIAQTCILKKESDIGLFAIGIGKEFGKYNSTEMILDFHNDLQLILYPSKAWPSLNRKTSILSNVPLNMDVFSTETRKQLLLFVKLQCDMTKVQLFNANTLLEMSYGALRVSDFVNNILFHLPNKTSSALPETQSISFEDNTILMSKHWNVTSPVVVVQDEANWTNITNAMTKQIHRQELAYVKHNTRKQPMIICASANKTPEICLPDTLRTKPGVLVAYLATTDKNRHIEITISCLDVRMDNFEEQQQMLSTSTYVKMRFKQEDSNAWRNKSLPSTRIAIQDTGQKANQVVTLGNTMLQESGLKASNKSSKTLKQMNTVKNKTEIFTKHLQQEVDGGAVTKKVFGVKQTTAALAEDKTFKTEVKSVMQNENAYVKYEQNTKNLLTGHSNKTAREEIAEIHKRLLKMSTLGNSRTKMGSTKIKDKIHKNTGILNIEDLCNETVEIQIPAKNDSNYAEILQSGESIQSVRKFISDAHKMMLKEVPAEQDAVLEWKHRIQNKYLPCPEKILKDTVNSFKRRKTVKEIGLKNEITEKSTENSYEQVQAGCADMEELKIPSATSEREENGTEISPIREIIEDLDQTHYGIRLCMSD